MDAPDEGDWERLQLPAEDLGPLVRRVGPGCPACQYAGYAGRLGCFEVLRIDDALRQLILRQADESELWRHARENGVVTMFEDALEKVRRGETTLEEVARLIPVDPWRERTTRRLRPLTVPVAPVAALPPPAPEPVEELPEELPELALTPLDAPAAPVPAPVTVAGGRARVLVVDDTEEILQLIGVTLEDTYEVLYARDGMEALDVVGSGAPDVVVLDVMMPRLSGYEVCRRLKDSPATESLPVLILSARGDSAHVKQGFQVGADDYLPKPFDPEELELRIRALLRRSGRLARAPTVG